MQVIPVLDLKSGQVVKARGGVRAAYQPLQSPLCDSSEPAAVLAALRTLYRFDTIYVADLDAIEGRDNQGEQLQSLFNGFSDCRFWLDAGSASTTLAGQAAGGNVCPVIGTETMANGETADHLGQWPTAVLSIDYRHGQLLGDTRILEQGDCWPRDVIVMTLDRVGADQGPATGQLRALHGIAPDRRFHAAGGVRDDDDLARLAAIGIHGALIASALHRGTIRSCRR